MVSGVAGVWAGPTTPFAGVTRNVRLSVKRGWGPSQGSLWTLARCGVEERTEVMCPSPGPLARPPPFSADCAGCGGVGGRLSSES